MAFYCTTERPRNRSLPLREPPPLPCRQLKHLAATALPQDNLERSHVALMRQPIALFTDVAPIREATVLCRTQQSSQAELQ
jgi:hypothetical protein